MKRAAVLVMLAALGPAVVAPAWAADDAAPAAQKSTAKSAAKSPSGGGGLDLTGGKSGTPLEVYADEGMELSQDNRKVIAHVNAKAIRGNITVRSDTMIAYYRDRAENPNASAAVKQKAKASGDQKTGGKKGADDQSGGSEIWRVEAIDHVTIASPSQTVYGDHADYNIDDAVVVVTGHDLRLVTPTDLVTARDTLEYWDQKQQAVARGNAVATRGEKNIRADVLVADFEKNEQGQMAITKAHGYDNVVLTTPKEVVTGDKADYDVPSGIVIITGRQVVLTQGDNRLNGQYAVINLNTGISKLYPTPPGGAATDQRVKGFFVPKKKDEPASGATKSTTPAKGQP